MTQPELYAVDGALCEECGWLFCPFSFGNGLPDYWPALATGTFLHQPLLHSAMTIPGTRILRSDCSGRIVFCEPTKTTISSAERSRATSSKAGLPKSVLTLTSKHPNHPIDVGGCHGIESGSWNTLKTRNDQSSQS